MTTTLMINYDSSFYYYRSRALNYYYTMLMIDQARKAGHSLIYTNIEIG